MPRGNSSQFVIPPTSPPALGFARLIAGYASFSICAYIRPRSRNGISGLTPAPNKSVNAPSISLKSSQKRAPGNRFAMSPTNVANRRYPSSRWAKSTPGGFPCTTTSGTTPARSHRRSVSSHCASAAPSYRPGVAVVSTRFQYIVVRTSRTWAARSRRSDESSSWCAPTPASGRVSYAQSSVGERRYIATSGLIRRSFGMGAGSAAGARAAPNSTTTTKIAYACRVTPASFCFWFLISGLLPLLPLQRLQVRQNSRQLLRRQLRHQALRHHAHLALAALLDLRLLDRRRHAHDVPHVDL